MVKRTIKTKQITNNFNLFYFNHILYLSIVTLKIYQSPKINTELSFLYRLLNII